MIRRWVTLRRWVKRVLVAIVVLIAATILTGRVRGLLLLKRAPAPGMLVDVGGRTMHLHCTGVGEPTVILESGLLDFSLLWARVQPDAATITRTCSYDRAGLGWSAASPTVRSSAAMVAELRALLRAADVPPPYVLVGHSFGGMNARLFAYTHPEEVAGLVLVDAAHEDQWTALPEIRAAIEGTQEQFRSLSMLRRAGVLTFVHTEVPDRGLPADAAEQYRTLLVASPYFAQARRELHGLDASAAQLRDARRGIVLDVPLVVISRGGAAPIPGVADSVQQRVEEVWRGLQREMVGMAKDAVQVVAEGSGHDVHVEQPSVVVMGIRRVVERVRPSSAW